MRIRSPRRGAALIEAAMFVPIMLALLVGTEELARVTYLSYMLQKVMTNLARDLSTQLGANFCDSANPAVLAAINNAITGTIDGSGDPVVTGLTSDMVQVRVERYDATSQQVMPCDCSATGCDASQGGLPPGFIVVSLIDGYNVRPRFWGFTISPFALRPMVRMPYAGT